VGKWKRETERQRWKDLNTLDRKTERKRERERERERERGIQFSASNVVRHI
jgi:hypothetical protein